MRTCDSIALADGVGSSRKALLERLSILSFGDMLLNLPVRFIDRRTVTPISNLKVGTDAVISGKIVSISRNRPGRGPVISAILSDDTGGIVLSFFRGGFPAAKLVEGISVTACGTVQSYRGFNMVHPDLYFNSEISEASTAPGMLPVYRLCSGLNQGFMRRLARFTVDSVRGELEEVLPEKVLSQFEFNSRWDVFRSAHLPSSPEEASSARDYLALEELFLYRSILEAVRSRGTSLPAAVISDFKLDAFESRMPWKLTSAQRKVCGEIRADIISGSPMRRLLQGDVGSGKTVVAAFGAVATVLSGYTACVLAPTEVLAYQHLKSMKKFCDPFDVKVHLLTGGTSPAARKALLGQLKSEPAAVLVGTHAVLENWVPLDSLAFLVVDEQHRFGVNQREKLLDRVKPRPHALIMSATPIPRTLAMTFYGDLDLSVLDEMPSGRGKTQTSVVGPSEKSSVFRFMVKRLEKGERAFLVYPLREASEKSDLRDAATAYSVICSGPASKYGAGLLHGSMSPAEKVEVTSRFSSGEINVLVSTTVIEVGIDVAEATVMVVVNAERFGLSQLHQLRGRVGRGVGDAWCFLVPGESASAEAMERLNVLAATADGFEVAGKDLQNRGPGQVLGTAQHGVPQFRIADLTCDGKLVERVNSMQPIQLDEMNRLLESQKWRYVNLVLPGLPSGT